MIEGEVVIRVAVLADEPIAQEDVEPGEGRCVVGLTNDFSDTTLGSWISKLGLRTARS